jgi:ribosomal protein S18 acetylase RimI-like enzyme
MVESSIQSAETRPFVRSYRRSDRESLVARLGPVISALYPAGDIWLARRLNDVESGSARCSIVTWSGSELLGAAIETPKEKGRLKLSTLWVDQTWRGCGLGKHLLLAARQRWLSSELELVNLTAEASVAGAMAALLARAGFRLECIDRDRYGEGRHEVVFTWRPDTDPLAAPNSCYEDILTTGLLTASC